MLTRFCLNRLASSPSRDSHIFSLMAPIMYFMGMKYFLSSDWMWYGMGRDGPTGCTTYLVKQIKTIALSTPLQWELSISISLYRFNTFVNYVPEGIESKLIFLLVPGVTIIYRTHLRKKMRTRMLQQLNKVDHKIPE